MLKKIRRQIKVPKTQSILDVEEFHKLTDLLFEMMKEKHQSCAKLLGISRSTWKKWERRPPRQWWWNMVLRAVIKEYLSAVQTRRGLTRSHRNKIRDRLAAIEGHEKWAEEIVASASILNGAQHHLRDTLGGKGMFWDELRKAGNSGGYSESSLRKAARVLGVVKTQEGYGEDKRSYWRLPNEYD